MDQEESRDDSVADQKNEAEIRETDTPQEVSRRGNHNQADASSALVNRNT